MRPVVLAALILSIPSFAITPAPLVTETLGENAPEQVQQQYGQLVGHWACKGENRQQDGSWQASPGMATWSWYYVLDGYAVQDVWQPPKEAPPSAAMGTNLRTYDVANNIWNVVWTTTSNANLEQFRSAYRNEQLHIYAERPASGSFPSHLMHITFHDISDDHFDWKYESSGLTDGQNWTEVSRLSCDRQSPESKVG